MPLFNTTLPASSNFFLHTRIHSAPSHTTPYGVAAPFRSIKYTVKTRVPFARLHLYNIGYFIILVLYARDVADHRYVDGLCLFILCIPRSARYYWNLMLWVWQVDC